MPLLSTGVDRLERGTLRQIHETSINANLSKALNALSLPFPQSDHELSCFDHNPLATCDISWKDTRGIVFDRDQSFPTADTHWGLAATTGANSQWHIDSDGFATTVDVRAGEKLWMMAGSGVDELARFGTILSEYFDHDTPPVCLKSEAILMKKNVRL